MCDAVKEYANEQSKIAEERAKIQANVNAVKRIMMDFHVSMDKALDTLDLNNDERKSVEEELKKEKM